MSGKVKIDLILPGGEKIGIELPTDLWERFCFAASLFGVRKEDLFIAALNRYFEHQRGQG
jgi:hypothetical protein